MLRHKLKYLLLLPATILLVSCHAGHQYTHFMRNPEVLRQALLTCETRQTLYCQQARACAQALSDFSALAARQRQVFMAAQAAGGDLTQRQREALYNAENSVQEQFGQHIMLAQARLVQLETQRAAASKGDDASSLQAQIVHQRQLIDAMRALVSLNNPE